MKGNFIFCKGKYLLNQKKFISFSISDMQEINFKDEIKLQYELILEITFMA